MLTQPVQKPRDRPKPYAQKPKAVISKNPQKTSAKSLHPKKHENLTLHDWTTVFAFVDEHPDLSQDDIVRHFASKKDGALIFTQSTLSRNLKPEKRKELESRITSYLHALSS